MVNIKLQIWDPPGKIYQGWSLFFKGASGVLFVVDLTDPDTFYSKEFTDLIKFAQKEAIGHFILLGNKIDLKSLEESGIKQDDIDELKSKFNISEFILTSAKSGKNIDLAFKKLSDMISNERMEQGTLKDDTVIKIALAGLPGVGKTSITQQYVFKTFGEKTKSTIGASFLMKEIQYSPDLVSSFERKRPQKHKKAKKAKAMSEKVPEEILSRETIREDEIKEAEEMSGEKPLGGIPPPMPSKPLEGDRISAEEVITKIERKATVFYKERMNPMKLNKMAVIISTKELYKDLKTVSRKVTRVSTGSTLEIEEEVPILEVKPIIPGCICSPPIAKLDARKEYDHCLFLITPLEDGEIPDARVEIFYKDEIIDVIPTPINVVKTTIVKISGLLALAVPIIGSLFDQSLEGVFKAIVPFYDVIGGLDGLLAILTGIFSVLTALFYYLRKPKDATPVESQSLSDVISTVAED